jgi:hypothetical protein
MGHLLRKLPKASSKQNSADTFSCVKRGAGEDADNDVELAMVA